MGMKHSYEEVFNRIVDNERDRQEVSRLAREIMKIVCKHGEHEYRGMDVDPDVDDSWLGCEELIFCAAIKTACENMPDNE